MSETRISLAEIRATSERATWVAPWQVLALVAAVEAAQAVEAIATINLSEWFWDPDWPEFDKLRAALAPFAEPGS